LFSKRFQHAKSGWNPSSTTPCSPFIKGIKKDSGPVCRAAGTGRQAGMTKKF